MRTCWLHTETVIFVAIYQPVICHVCRPVTCFLIYSNMPNSLGPPQNLYISLLYSSLNTLLPVCNLDFTTPAAEDVDPMVKINFKLLIKEASNNDPEGSLYGCGLHYFQCKRDRRKTFSDEVDRNKQLCIVKFAGIGCIWWGTCTVQNPEHWSCLAADTLSESEIAYQQAI